MTYPAPSFSKPTFPPGPAFPAGGGVTTASQTSKSPPAKTSDNPGSPFNGPITPGSTRPQVDPKTGNTYNGGNTFNGPVPPGQSRPRVDGRGNIMPWAKVNTSDNSLFDILNLPTYIDDKNASFTMEVDNNDHEITQYTIGAGLDWFRHLAVTDKDAYNSLVYSLYSAGYLKDADVRFNSFTSTAAQAFAEAAWDVYTINKGQDGGGVTTFMNHLDALAQGMADSGLGPGGSGSGSNKQALTRTDVKTDPETLKANGRAAAQSLLGRSLSPEEEKEFMGVFSGLESTYNDQQWASQQANYNGEPDGGTVTDRPNAAAVAQSFVKDDLGQEKAGQDLGSYMGVIRNMMGLGSAGNSLA